MTSLSTTTATRFQLRPATAGDCGEIAAVLASFAQERIFLWHTPEDIAAHLESFCVAVVQHEVVGCAALYDYGNGAGLMEVRSLAVRRDGWGQGIGAALVADCIARAKERQAKCVFALTRQVAFFSKCGFHVTGKDEFPQKVWADCQCCRKRECCDETAMRLDLPVGTGC
jgi:argininosuccinate lyase/amino-acid N-acetyltransferase